MKLNLSTNESIYIVAHVLDLKKISIIAAFKTKRAAERFISACQQLWDYNRVNGDNIKIIGKNGKVQFLFDEYASPYDLKLIESETAGIDIPFFNK